MCSKKVIISACLLGQNCRYDGKTKKVNEVLEAFKDYEIIPFCPEAPLFGTPRERINVIHVDGKNRIITDETNKDVTQLLEDEINTFVKQNLHVDVIVLKSKSPSCGFGTTPILNCEKEIIKYGNGIAAEIFLVTYADINIKDEYLNI
ncbi:DUF523 domain-containing protein [Candidatus Sulfurimonas baltica]|uniref:DUF523 domain-containing protein n=1 Tax=Candidatus Sulfurimonas baltica TaxID=2740404 RepID=A0A7S7LUZ0_9BACT|nr:DUF523 domain-containing protein [Candidatus Sulfurimonas baltica]QOY51878.1 DUF523 domain-containing protein [Candidatus Sulfurimonas baltica]